MKVVVKISNEMLEEAQEVADAFNEAYGDYDAIMARLEEQMTGPLNF